MARWPLTPRYVSTIAALQLVHHVVGHKPTPWGAAPGLQLDPAEHRRIDQQKHQDMQSVFFSRPGVDVSDKYFPPGTPPSQLAQFRLPIAVPQGCATNLPSIKNGVVVQYPLRLHAERSPHLTKLPPSVLCPAPLRKSGLAAGSLLDISTPAGLQALAGLSVEQLREVLRVPRNKKGSCYDFNSVAVRVSDLKMMSRAIQWVFPYHKVPDDAVVALLAGIRQESTLFARTMVAGRPEILSDLRRVTKNRAFFSETALVEALRYLVDDAVHNAAGESPVVSLHKARSLVAIYLADAYRHHPGAGLRPFVQGLAKALFAAQSMPYVDLTVHSCQMGALIGVLAGGCTDMAAAAQAKVDGKRRAIANLIDITKDAASSFAGPGGGGIALAALVLHAINQRAHDFKLGQLDVQNTLLVLKTAIDSQRRDQGIVPSSDEQYRDGQMAHWVRLALA